MSSGIRERISDSLRDTTSAISRATATLLVTCLSAVILNGVDDSVVLGNQTVSTPFVGQTRYNLFMLLAPAFITVLRLYVDLQLAHLTRLTRIVARRRIPASLSLLTSNSPILWGIGALSIHLVPPLSIATIGYHASALYPERGLALYVWAAALLIWSFVQIYFQTYARRLSFAAATISVFALFLCGIALGNRDRAAFCERRYDGSANALTPWILRFPEFSYANLGAGHYEDANLSCGDMESARFRGADVRFTKFWFADLYKAEFVASSFSYAEFDGAHLRHTDMSGSEGPFSQFFAADLDGSNFSNTKLDNAKFNFSLLDQTNFEKATLRTASFYRTELSFVNFVSSDLRYAKFDNAKLIEVDFTDAEVRNANFDGATLEGVRFDGADLSCSSFLNATMNSVDFSHVAPGGLRGVQLPKSSNMTSVKWPKDYAILAPIGGAEQECTTER